MELLMIILLVFELFFFPVYIFWSFFQLYKRRQLFYESDEKMINTGRIFTLLGTIGIILVAKDIKDDFNLYLLLISVFVVIFVLGFRIIILGHRVKEENKDTFYYDWDQWLEKIYRKYLEPLWKDKK